MKFKASVGPKTTAILKNIRNWARAPFARKKTLLEQMTMPNSTLLDLLPFAKSVSELAHAKFNGEKMLPEENEIPGIKKAFEAINQMEAEGKYVPALVESQKIVTLVSYALHDSNLPGAVGKYSVSDPSLLKVIEGLGSNSQQLLHDAWYSKSLSFILFEFFNSKMIELHKLQARLLGKIAQNELNAQNFEGAAIAFSLQGSCLLDGDKHTAGWASMGKSADLLSAAVVAFHNEKQAWDKLLESDKGGVENADYSKNSKLAVEKIINAYQSIDITVSITSEAESAFQSVRYLAPPRQP